MSERKRERERERERERRKSKGLHRKVTDMPPRILTNTNTQAK